MEMHSGQGALDEVDYTNGEEEVNTHTVQTDIAMSTLSAMWTQFRMKFGVHIHVHVGGMN